MYPKPVYDKITEPFAGAASYSLRYFEKDITLIDKNPMIIKVWQYLQSCSLSDIKNLPRYHQGHVLNESDFDCEGQFLLMRLIIAQASYGGNNKVSKWGAMRFENNIKKLVNNHHKIKHWKFVCGDFINVENTTQTWFIDPPYFVGGHKYPMSNRRIDYSQLARWCQSLNGQVIVCENTAANWLPFVPIKRIQGVARQTTEAIWTNTPTHYNNRQQEINFEKAIKEDAA